MLVRPTRSFPGTLFLFRGSAFSHVWPVLIAVGLNAAIIATQHEWMRDHALTLTATPFSILGVALSIFLGFRNNACYDRWWEARKLWGLLINRSRATTRIVLDACRADEPIRQELVYHTIAFAHVLRFHLRDQLSRLDEIAHLVPPETLAKLRTSRNVPNMLLQCLGDRVSASWKRGEIDAYHLPLFEDQLTTLADIQGACERIKNTPVPLTYTILTHRVVGMYCLTLPLGLVDTVGLLTPVVVLIVSYAFLGFDSVGSQIEDPFEEDPNDLPLAAICRLIEVNLKEQLGETDLPPLLGPVDGILV